MRASLYGPLCNQAGAPGSPAVYTDPPSKGREPFGCSATGLPREAQPGGRRPEARRLRNLESRVGGHRRKGEESHNYVHRKEGEEKSTEGIDLRPCPGLGIRPPQGLLGQQLARACGHPEAVTPEASRLVLEWFSWGLSNSGSQ